MTDECPTNGHDLGTKTPLEASNRGNFSIPWYGILDVRESDCDYEEVANYGTVEMANWLKFWGWLTVSLMALTPIQAPLHHWTCHSPQVEGSAGNEETPSQADSKTFGTASKEASKSKVKEATCRGCLCHRGNLERPGSATSPCWNSAEEDCQVCFQLATQSSWLTLLATPAWGYDLLAWHASGYSDHQYASHDTASRPRGPPRSI